MKINGNEKKLGRIVSEVKANTDNLKKQDHPAQRETEKSLPPEEQCLEFFSLFIHDLRAPLLSTKYLLNLLNEGNFDPSSPRHQRMVRSALTAMERLESIIDDTLAMAKADALGWSVRLVNIVPENVIKEAIELIRGLAEENDVRVTYTNNSGNTPVKTDPRLLKRVLDNLLYNAVRHTPPNESVAVYTDVGKGCLYIHIKDSGDGLPEVEPEKLFEKFGQVEARRQGKHQGVGLGLYFCRRALTEMGGSITAANHPKGGAEFTVTLAKAEE